MMSKSTPVNNVLAENSEVENCSSTQLHTYLKGIKLGICECRILEDCHHSGPRIWMLLQLPQYPFSSGSLHHNGISQHYVSGKACRHTKGHPSPATKTVEKTMRSAGTSADHPFLTNRKASRIPFKTYPRTPVTVRNE
jgi:hypothetical protein